MIGVVQDFVEQVYATQHLQGIVAPVITVNDYPVTAAVMTCVRSIIVFLAVAMVAVIAFVITPVIIASMVIRSIIMVL
ncbi:MAG: hypothetical protein VR73_05810 [Gammaproteobacteria bacterium BRH_c0]|nr:MAG: hypothetical protein VR73_05810 [Gammaproteobacteria bacterium BRH_c0]